MTKPRLFFLICLTAALLLVIAVPLADGAFAPRAIPDEAAAGFAVWQAHDCAGCHSLDGQGGAYASDLTRSYAQRGNASLRAFLADPAVATIRQMPHPGLSADEIDQVIAFLKWESDQAAAGGTT